MPRKAVSTRVVWHSEVCPERFVHTREVKIHASERLQGVLIRFDSQVSHPAQPEVHSLSSPVFISTKATVAPEQSTKRPIIQRHITIINQLLHHFLCHVHSSHRSSPAGDYQIVCHDIRTHSFASLHLLEQSHCTIHVLQLDPALHECGISMNGRPQS